MATMKIIRNVILPTLGKVVLVLVLDLALLRWGALAVNAHNDALLAVGAGCYLIALAVTIAGAGWIFVGVRRHRNRTRRLT